MTSNAILNKHLLPHLGLLLFLIILFDCRVFAEQAPPTAVKSTQNPIVISEVSTHPVLTWEGYPDAVIYELEIAQTESFSAENIIYHSTSVYSSGCQPDLSQWLGYTLCYRVRPLDYDRNPIGDWTSPATFQVTHPEDFDQFQPHTIPTWSKVTPILYPVYSWIPVFNAAAYKVEVFSVDKSVPLQSKNRYRLLSTYNLDGSLIGECYDEASRVGDFAWHVQALDKDKQPIGLFSDLEEFSLEAIPGKFPVGVFGDSIMHGGGAVSGSPSDFHYSLHAYLDLPALNLAKSGDTSEASLQRFDKDIVPFAPQTLLVLTGTNSIRGGESAENVITQLNTIYNKCLENNIAPVFLTLPPINPDRISIVFQQKSATNWQVEMGKVNQYILLTFPHLDVAPLFADEEGKIPVKWSTDGLHPDSKAKQLIANIFNHSKFNNSTTTSGDST